MIRKPKIGLLPLYLALYDESLPTLRAAQEEFSTSVLAALRNEGLEVHVVHTCSVRHQIAEAMQQFTAADVDLLVTLHLSYSPSLEAVDELATSLLPLVLLDTTPDFDFGREVDPERLLFNHGIHGVQDLAAMLRRRGKSYRVVAGHITDSRVLSRIHTLARSASAARHLQRTRAVRIGAQFVGMGDFQVDPALLHRRLGITVDEVGAGALCEDIRRITEGEIAEEVAHDRQRYVMEIDPEVHHRSVHMGLGLRKFLHRGDYQAFSMNFLAFDKCDGEVNTVPFLECAKAMARGIGYAGEGDVLTAALVGALQSVFGETTFTEMFCPDWQGGTIILSHMGEANPELSAEKPLLYEKLFPYTAALNPAVLGCAPRPGAATLVNLAPGPDESFRLIISHVDVLEDGTHPDIKRWVRGWIKPRIALETFLERYSELGGTHHSALILGEHCEALLAFADMLEIEGYVI